MSEMTREEAAQTLKRNLWLPENMSAIREATRMAIEALCVTSGPEPPQRVAPEPWHLNESSCFLVDAKGEAIPWGIFKERVARWSRTHGPLLRALGKAYDYARSEPSTVPIEILEQWATLIAEAREPRA